MTKSRYAVASLLRHFGITRKAKRLTDAAYEMHLMQDGEEILGAYCWPNTEEIEDLSLAYWNLRRLEKEQKAVLEHIYSAEEILLEAHDQKTSIVRQIKEGGSIFDQERDELDEELKSLKEELENKRTSALGTKKKHGALKMKITVLQQEDSTNTTEIERCRDGLAEFREVFMKEKTELNLLKSKIGIIENKLKIVQSKIDAEQEGSTGEANQAYAGISRANQDITTHQAQLASIEEEQVKLFREVGHFLNIQSKRADCQKACKKHRSILGQLKLLYQSIRYNRRLADR